ncbi:MAG: outer membrane beta-barrel protein [Candidatus Limimorpha sp.]
MIRKLLLLITMVVLSLSASAQFLEYQLGLKAAVGMDWMDTYCDNFKEKEDNGLCYKFGLTGTYFFKESYGITSGFNIVRGGFSNKYKYGEQDLTYSFRNSYVQVPILLRMRTGVFAKKLRVFSEIGYGLDIMVKCRDSYYFSSAEVEDFKSPKYRAISNSFILHIGLEIEVMNTSSLLVMIGYDDFFTSIIRPDSFFGNSLTMNNLCLEIGFLF